MRQVYPNEGLTQWLSRDVSANLLYGLFTNNITIDRTTTFGALVEAFWAGYARVTVSAGWTLSQVGFSGFAIGTPISFLNSTGAPVQPYGYFVLDATGTFLMAVGKFDNFPITIDPGDSYVLIPSIGDLSRATASP